MKTFRSVLAVMLSLLALTLLFAGCSPAEKEEASSSAPVEESTEQPAANAKRAKACADAVTKAVAFPEMTEAPKRAVETYYGVDTELLSDYYALLTSSGATADEVAVFIAKDEAEVKNLLALLEQRRADQIASFTGYVDTEVPRLEKAKIGSVGNVCYFICAADPTACETALKKLLA